MPSNTVTFETNEPSLGEYLRQIESGAIQLPDFQRSWVWGDVAIQELIASVTRAYPIGAVMLLETGGEGASFLPRLFEGVNLKPRPDPGKLVLDGQQRLTSLFLALLSSDPVPTRTEKRDEVTRLYYLDMSACLDSDTDRIDAVISIPDSKKLTSSFGRITDLDLTSTTNEYENGMFPLNLTFDRAKYNQWRREYIEHFHSDANKIQFLFQFESEILDNLKEYRLPVIELKKETAKEAVCQVFEKVNTGGISLTVFEIVTATFAAYGFRLRDNWDTREERLHEFHEVLSGVGGSEFLQAVTLVARYRRSRTNGSAISVRRRDVLALQLDEYEANADAVEEGFKRAARLLSRERIFDQRNLPYGTQLVPLAAVCAYLGRKFEENEVRQKLARWYWCGVFGEMYGGANETRYAMDMQDLIGWTLEGTKEPRTVRDADFAPMRLLSLRTRQSAAYKGLFALMMKKGSRDFMSGDPISHTTGFALPVDIHHIFPRAWCRRNHIDNARCNSVINKAPITSQTNRVLGGNSPSDYLTRLIRNGTISLDSLNNVLATHWIDPELLRSDNIDFFLRDRASKLLDAIEVAMGKPVQGRDSEEVVNAFNGSLAAGAVPEPIVT